MSLDSVKILSKETFNQYVENTSGTVLVDFWAPWCGPCRMVSPVIDEIAVQFEGKVTVAKLNVDDENEIATKFGVVSIPTMILFHNGQQVERVVGATTKQELEQIISKHIN